jgi:hypothetical protein
MVFPPLNTHKQLPLILFTFESGYKIGGRYRQWLSFCHDTARHFSSKPSRLKADYITYIV